MCDSTGLSTRKYERWLEVRNSEQRKRKRFVRLHAHITMAEILFFLAAKATKGYKSTSKQFSNLLIKAGGVIEVRDMTLDRGHLSRLNSRFIMNNSAQQYIAL